MDPTDFCRKSAEAGKRINIHRGNTDSNRRTIVNTFIKLFVPALLLAITTFTGIASATDIESTMEPDIAINDITNNPVPMLDNLQSHLFELRKLLAQQPQDIILIKTETSWTRKQLRELRDWAVHQHADANIKSLTDRFYLIIDSMLQTVACDDMLDDTDVQSLLVKHTQASQIMAEIQRHQEQAGKPQK
ncbi:MAG: hypothetical protein QG652_855 [Pseudomonadota bacterium]|nr:hypothetical protein [Pseudomonadota bacterium]